MGPGRDDRRVERVPRADEVVDVPAQPVSLLFPPFRRGLRVPLTRRFDAGQQFHYGPAGQSGTEQTLDERDPLRVGVRVVPLPTGANSSTGRL